MSAQTGWRWCDKCQGMFFSENPSHGVCAADNYPRDDHASGHYVIQFGDAVAGAQGHWFDPKVPQESQIAGAIQFAGPCIVEILLCLDRFLDSHFRFRSCASL